MRDLRQLLAKVPVLIAVQHGADLRIELFGLRGRDGLQQRDLAGKRAEEAFPELARWLRRIGATACMGSPCVAVDEPVTLDWSGTGRPETRYLSCVCEPLRAPDGAVDGSVTLAVDVTASVKARAPSQPERAWFEATLDAIATPVILAEPGTQYVLFANAAARELSRGAHAGGGTLGHAIGLQTTFCTDPSGSPIPEDELPAAKAGRGEVVDGMELLWHAPFGRIPIVCFAEKVPATEAHPALTVVSLFDATDAKSAERELVEELRIRDEFIGLVAHELRTPLTALKLQAQSLMKKHPDIACLCAVERAVGRIESLVEQMLDAASIRESGVRLEPEDLDLCAVADVVIARLRSEATGVRSPIARTGDTAVRGRWDRRRLEHVIGNLVCNALRFGAGKPVGVECRDLGARVSVAVSDEGIGIDPADQARIFERFCRAVPPWNYGGLGLGLWMVREIVTSMGGTIAVKSAPGQGATFTVELPKKGATA